MALKHTEPEYTIEELKLLIDNEIGIDKSLSDREVSKFVNDFIEYIDKKEKNIHSKTKLVLSIADRKIENKSKKIFDFLDTKEFADFIVERKFDLSGFYDSSSEELTGNVLFEDVLNEIKHRYDDDVRNLKKTTGINSYDK